MEAKVKRIEVVAGLIFRHGKILACQRKDEGMFPLKWEFPGGKVEEGEGCADALRRELIEELGIEIGTTKPVLQYEYKYAADWEVHLRFFRVCDYQGEIQNFVFERLAWLAVDQLDTVDFLEGDLPLVQFLRSHQSSDWWT
jgi:mutator protein MutT